MMDGTKKDADVRGGVSPAVLLREAADRLSTRRFKDHPLSDISWGMCVDGRRCFGCVPYGEAEGRTAEVAQELAHWQAYAAKLAYRSCGLESTVKFRTDAPSGGGSGWVRWCVRYGPEGRTGL